MKKLTILLLILPLYLYGNDVKGILPEGTQLYRLSNEGLTDQYFYRIGPQKELYIVHGGVCLNYYNSLGQTFAFPSYFNVTDVFWLDNGDCLFSDSSSIYYKNNDACDSVIRLIHTDMNQIRFKPSHYGIYYFDSQGSELWFYSYPRAESMIVCQFPDTISNVSVIDDLCFIAYAGKIGMIKRNQEYASLFNVSTTISSLALVEDGSIFYGTRTGLFYYDNEGRHYPILNLGVRDLLIEGENLYIIFIDGSSARIQGISAYKDLIDKIENHTNVPETGTSNNVNRTHSLFINGQIDQLESLYAESIQQMQEKRNAGKGVSGDLLGEYAYALALNHNFEVALMNIDRARLVGTKYGDFYAAQILTLMGYTDAAGQLMRQAKVPDWINGIYQGQVEKY